MKNIPHGSISCLTWFQELRGKPVEVFRCHTDGKRSTRMTFAVELLLTPSVTVIG